MKEIKRIGVLTSGGDAPGMNAAVRAVTRLALYKGIEVMGIYNGYQGLIEDNVKPLHERDVSFIINRGGTMLYSARSNDFRTKEGRAKAVENCRKHGIDGIVTIGGDGTFRGAVELTNDGVPCIGIPATIDNDIASPEATIGFDTAMNTVVDLVDKLRDTSESHSRCTVVEVMGREAGDIALQTSIALGAVTAVIREIPTDFDHVIEKMVAARKGGKRNFIIITCEGMGKDYGEELSAMIEARSGIESRFARLAHIQRGGAPTLRDRVLATQMGCAAVENLISGQMKQVMCLRGNNIVAMDIFDALTVDKLMKGKLKPEEEDKIPPNKLYEMKRIVADKQAYKNYLNYIIDHITL